MVEAWVDSGLLKPNATEHIMNEKAYKRAKRAHRIFLQSAADAFSARILTEIIPRSLPRNIYLLCSAENAGALITSL